MLPAEAIQFLKKIWLPDDTNGIDRTRNMRVYLAKFFSIEYDENLAVKTLAIKHPPPQGAVAKVPQLSCALRRWIASERCSFFSMIFKHGASVPLTTKTMTVVASYRALYTRINSNYML